MKIKIYEISDTNNNQKWYVLYDKKNDYENFIFNNGYDEIDLPAGYTLEKNAFGEPYICKNGFVYNIHKDDNGYFLYPAILTIAEAIEQNRQIYINPKVNIGNLIPLAEYAKLHNKELSVVRRKAERGGFKTARKIGRNWIIERDEPYVDNRYRKNKSSD